MKCCGFEMTERKDFDSGLIYWCPQCGKKVLRGKENPVETSESMELGDDCGEVDNQRKGEGQKWI